MKYRFSTIDVKRIVNELSATLVDVRLINIYHVNSRILLLKLGRSDVKHQLIIESGYRLHLTQFARTTAGSPSPFITKLRSFLKTRRVTAVSQIGTDRIIEFQFSDGLYRLYLEFFAGGNVILTDECGKILALLRNVSEGEGQESQRVGLVYNLSNRQNYAGAPPLTRDRLREALQAMVAKAATQEADGRKSRKKQVGELKRGLAASMTELPPVLVHHVFLVAGFNASTNASDLLENGALFDALFQCLSRAREMLDELTSSTARKGYIIAKARPGPAASTAITNTSDVGVQAEDLVYEDFQPFRPKQFEDDRTCTILEFDGYNATVDMFFSSLESQILESRLTEREEAANRKLEATRQDLDKRVQVLQGYQLENLRKAAAIEANVDRIQEAMDAVNSLLDQGMDWSDINKLIEREKGRNQIAEMIKLPIKFSDNIVTLVIAEEREEGQEADTDLDYETDEEESEGGEKEKDKRKGKSPEKHMEVNIRLDLSPWGNAREYYEQKRTAADKEAKTQQSTVLALQRTKQKIELAKGIQQEKPVLHVVRKQMWFEKFKWFISSDGYLVLAGHDAQQSESLYRRCQKNDVYVHADVDGATSVFVMNHRSRREAEVPPSITCLVQAGIWSVCTSSAWESKAATMAAWWATSSQVSKYTPTGELLPAGRFMMRGKRNFLPPSRLVLGFGVMFKVSEQSKLHHVRHMLQETDQATSSTGSTVVSTANPESREECIEPAARAGERDEGWEGEGDDEYLAHPRRMSNPLQDTTINPTEPSQRDVADNILPLDEMVDLTLSNIVSTNDGADRQISIEDGQKETVTEEEQERQGGEGGERSCPPSVTCPGRESPSPSLTAGQKKTGVTRAQRSKAKKLARYKDQDEEDRALMEKLVGIAAGRKKAEAEAAARAQRRAKEDAVRELRVKQKERAARAMAEHEAIRSKLMAEDGDEIEDGSRSKELSAIDQLFGTPLPGDEILELVPVCAPWSAMGKIKYKAKLQPGKQKKGKAVKEIVTGWIAAAKGGAIDDGASEMDKIWPRELELIKAMKVEEAFNVVPVSKLSVVTNMGTTGRSGRKTNAQDKGGRGGRGSRRQ